MLIEIYERAIDLRRRAGEGRGTRLGRGARAAWNNALGPLTAALTLL
jgi:hypothetical protein